MGVKQEKGPEGEGHPSGPEERESDSLRSEIPGTQSPEGLAFLEFQAAWHRGEEPGLEEFLAAHPEAGPELRSLIEDFLFVAREMGENPEGTRVVDTRTPPPPPTLEPDLPERVGPYKVIRLLGEGGMGAVYLVEQTEPVRRLAALKLVKKGMDSKRVLQRFDAERQALVMMDHPNIARILDAGTAGTGQPYFLMEYIDGLPIHQYCRKKGLGLEDRIRLFLGVCAGVRHAHQKGIIHRDIKPGNILVTEKEGKAVPKIIDFGLARAMGQRLVEGSIYSLEGQVIGTPEYMSPEQAGWRSQDVDTRTDIYSLGVVLYELLTGSLPYPGEDLRKVSVLEIQRKLFEEDPVRPSTRAARLPAGKSPIPGLDSRLLARRLKGDLDWILMKALEKDRERRYQTAAEFSEDLERYLEGEPVTARPPSLAYKSWKFLRKHGLLSGAVLAVLLTVFGALYFSLQEARARIRVERQNRKMAQEQAQREKALRESLQRAMASARDTTDKLLAVAAIQQKEARGAEEVLWTEDFESYPEGSYICSPRLKSRWRLGADNKKAWVVTLPGFPRGTGKCLELVGRNDYPDGVVLCTPLDPSSRSYLADFTVEFWVRPYEGPVKKDPNDRCGVDLNTRPHWSGKSAPLFTVDGDWRIETAGGARFRTRFPKEGIRFHHVRLQYQRICPGMVRMTLSLDGGKPEVLERKALPFEDKLVWITIDSGSGETWFDDIRVTRPARGQPLRKFPYAPRHEYLLTPRPMTRSAASALARRWGARLASAENRWIRRWFLLTFGHADFWVGGREKGGLFPFLRGSVVSGENPEVIPEIGFMQGDALLPGILEFSRHPSFASAVKTGQGCRGDLEEAPRLLAAAPPVAGRALELVLDGVPRGARPFLAVGRKEADLDLSAAGLSGCRLCLRPEICIYLGWGCLLYTSPSPRD